MPPLWSPCPCVSATISRLLPTRPSTTALRPSWPVQVSMSTASFVPATRYAVDGVPATAWIRHRP